MNDLRLAALDYASRGWRVVPLYNIRPDGSCACGKADCDGNSRGKHPRLTQWQEKASADHKKIEYWWGMWPLANVGVMCGQDTGFMVVDVDGPEGEASLEGKDWPKTQKVKTGRGCHYHFKWPKLDFKLRNNAAILPGIDIKVGKGQVAMPPSVHYNGTKYEWMIGPDECELADAPAWFVEILKEKYGAKTRLEENIKKLENNKKSAINNKYAMRAFEDEVAAVTFAPEGKRNEQLNRSAYSLATLIAGGSLDEWDVRTQLGRAAQRAGLGEHEIEATLDSALGAGKKHPREIPKSEVVFKPLPKEEEQLSIEKKAYTLNNRGNVERLADRHAGDLRYIREMKEWVAWSGKHWQKNETAIFGYLDDIVADLYEETRSCEDNERREKLARFSAQCGSNSNFVNTVALASKNTTFSTSILEFDDDDCFFNLRNGVLDLEDLKLIPHHPYQKIMKIADYNYESDADCPRFKQFLSEIFDSNLELIEYIQRVFGYTLTGSMAEKCFFFLYGSDGDNGKSKFLDALRFMGGEYAKNADISTFMYSKNERVRDDLAALYGARIITTAEPEEGSRFAMNVLKPWTGGDPQTCRELYGKIFTYQPKGKIFLAANNKPAIYERTDAAWSRVHLIPFNKSIPKERQDKHLDKKFKSEVSGILNWAIDGLKDYRTLGGLYPPQIIRDAVNAYRREFDSVRVFTEEACVIGKNEMIYGPALYTAYKDFCVNAGLKALGLGKFNAAMLDVGTPLGVIRARKETGYIWKGIFSKSLHHYQESDIR